MAKWIKANYMVYILSDDKKTVKVVTLDKDFVCSLTLRETKVLKRFDGRRDLDEVFYDCSASERVEYMDKFEKYCLIEPTGFIKSGFVTYKKMLWNNPNPTKGFKSKYSGINGIFLNITCLGFLLCALKMCLNKEVAFNLFDGSYWVFVLCIVVNFFVAGSIHELAHAWIAMSYNVRVYGAGIFVGPLTLSPFVSITSEIKSKYIKFQVNCAGVETGVIIASISVILTKYMPDYSFWLTVSAFINFLFVIFNFSFVNTTDGFSIISTLLGFTEEKTTFKATRLLLFSKEVRDDLSDESKVHLFPLLVWAVVLLISQFLGAAYMIFSFGITIFE